MKAKKKSFRIGNVVQVDPCSLSHHSGMIGEIRGIPVNPSGNQLYDVIFRQPGIRNYDEEEMLIESLIYVAESAPWPIE